MVCRSRSSSRKTSTHVLPTLAGVTDGGAMVHGGTDQLGQQEVGPVAHRYLNGLRHADSGIQDHEAMCGRGEHAP